jgi:hypothetical protein
MKYLSIMIVIAFTGCGSKHVEPTPEADIDKKAAEVAFSKTRKDVNGVSTVATGSIIDIESIAEPTADEMVEYRTGEPGWVTVEHTLPFNNKVTFSQAKQELLQYLRNEAVSKKVPPTVEVTSLLTDMMSESGGAASEQSAWSGFFKSTVSGVITAEEIMMDGFPEEIENGYKKTMKLKAYVEPVNGNRDPGFTVKAELSDNTLSSGDELSFALTPTQDSYLYAFNLMADHSVLLVFPNDYMPDNHISAGETVQIPNSNMRGYVRFRVGTLPGQELTTESIYVVCTKDIVTVADDLPRIGTGMPASGDSKSFIRLQRWLTNIPLDRRVEKNLIYHVAE